MSRNIQPRTPQTANPDPITTWLRAVAEAAPPPELPSAEELWHKAEVLRQLHATEDAEHEAAKRAERARRTLARSQIGWGIGALVTLTFTLSTQAPPPGTSTSPMLWLALVAAGMPMLAVAALITVWREA